MGAQPALSHRRQDVLRRQSGTCDQLNPHRVKCTPERFAELVEIEGIIPAPYMAHNKWVAVQELGALRQAELKELIQVSYQLVLHKLPKKAQASLAEKPTRKTRNG